jgi:hypothetical protein
MCFPSANFTTFPDVLKKIHQILDINKKIGGKINLATTLFHSRSFPHTKSLSKLHTDNKVIGKVSQLGGENGQFQHNRASYA